MDTAARKDPIRRRRTAACLVAGALVLSIVLLLFLRVPDHAVYPIKYQQIVENWSAEYSLDPYLIYAVIRTESSFDPNAESSAGARGLMQMTEDTFFWVKGKIADAQTLTFDDLFTPEVSVRFGCFLLAATLERYGGDVGTAAAAYHSGWGTVDSLLEDAAYSGDGLTLNVFPYEQMQHYVNKITLSYEKYTSLYA